MLHIDDADSTSGKRNIICTFPYKSDIFLEASAMNEATFEKKLADLIEELRHLPASCDPEPIVLVRRKNQTCREKLPKTTRNIQDSMDFLRLSVKYLLFDLEATRRENAYLRRLVNDD